VYTIYSTLKNTMHKLVEQSEVKQTDMHQNDHSTDNAFSNNLEIDVEMAIALQLLTTDRSR